MKYRTNVSLPDGVKPDDIPKRKGYKTLTYKLKVITPIYGGGVEAGKPDEDMPIRATAIRGQLRYWWRFLQMNHPDKSKRLTGEKLFKKERKIWGGMTDKTDDDGSSKVFVQVKEIEGIDAPEPSCEYTPYTDKNGHRKYRLNFKSINGITIPQYAMFPAQGKPPNSRDYNPKTDKPHKIFSPNIIFTLNLVITDTSFVSQVEEAIRWWICFGGIGARTRRGLGSIECIDSKFSSINSKEVIQYECKLKTLKANNAMDAWNKAIARLQIFRQGADVGRMHKKDKKGKKLYWGSTPQLGRSLWPEPDSIREIANTHSKKNPNNNRCNRANTHKPKHKARISFPRAQFGLPIIFKFKDGDEKCGDPKQSELRPANTERMSSPIILKAMKTESGFCSIALKLPVNHQKNLTLALKEFKDRPNNLDEEQKNEWKNKNWEQWQNNWWSDNKANNVLPINNRGTNALDAFMNFFDEGDE